MQLELVPTLEAMRDVYAIPHGRERFYEYLRTMIGGDGELRLPLPMMNPMGRAHVAARVTALIALDAEAIARDALRVAEQRLSGIDDALRVALVLADDTAGGWTNRYLSDMQLRFEAKYVVRHGWVTAVLWTSDPVDAALLRRTVLAAVRRTVAQRATGLPATLDEMLAQEGEALAFAGEPLRYDPEHCAAIARLLEPFGSSRAFGVTFAALYGDEIARSCGYEALGIPAWGGFDAALARARANGGGSAPRNARTLGART
ncbi:MAG: hypothetical protein NVSMB19_12860 [Vulcanimicrobiaceae bacterium]